MTYSYASSATRPSSASSQQTIAAGATTSFNFTSRGAADNGLYEVSITASGTLSAFVSVTFEVSPDGTRPFSADGQGEIFFTPLAAGTHTFHFTSRAPRVRATINNTSSSSVTADLFENFETEDT